MPRRRAAVATLLLCLLVSSAAATASPAPQILVASTAPSPVATVDDLPTPTPTPTVTPTSTATPTTPTSVSDGEFPLLLRVLGAIALIIVAAVIVAALPMVLLQVRRSTRHTLAAARDTAPPARTLADEELADDLDALLVTYAESPSDLIIAAWRRFEEVGATATVPRAISEGSIAYTLRVAASTGADEADLAVLGDLYRQAMFSAHPPSRADEERATQIVASLVATIRRSAV